MTGEVVIQQLNDDTNPLLLIIFIDSQQSQSQVA